MDLSRLPQFPVKNEERHREKNEFLLTWRDSLCTLFEFGTGLALVNSILLALVAARLGIDAEFYRFFTACEAVVLFGGIALLIVMSRLQDDATSPVLTIRLLLLAPVMGGIGGFGIASCLWWLLGYVEALGHPLQGQLDHLLAGLLFGALLGFISGGVLIFAGGTPEWGVGRLFTVLGKALPTLIRSVLFRKRKHEVRIPAKPWLEGVVWFACVGGPIAWFLS